MLWPIDGQVTADQQRTADTYFEAGVIDRAVDVAPAFDPTFNDTSGV